MSREAISKRLGLERQPAYEPSDLEGLIEMTSYHYLTYDALAAERRHSYLADGEAARLAREARKSPGRPEGSAAAATQGRAVLLRRLIPRWR